MRKKLLGLALLLPFVTLAQERQDGQLPELRFAAGRFRPLGPEMPVPDWYAGAPLDRSALGQRYLVAILRSPMDPEQRRRLEAAGAELLDYVPDRGYRLRVAPEAEAELRALPFVAWLGAVPPHFKVDPQLSQNAARAGGESRLRVLLAASEPPVRVLEILKGLTTHAAPSGKDGAWRVEFGVPGGRMAGFLSRLVGLPEVEAVEPVRPVRPLNQDAVWVHQSFVGPSPQQTPVFDRGIFGCGQVIALADTGQDYDLCYFRDTVNGPPPIVTCAAAPCPASAPAPGRRKDILYYNWSGTPTGEEDTCPTSFLGGSGHGSHTSGSAAGDSPPYANCSTFSTPGRNGGDGQAPGAKLVLQELGDGLDYLNELGGTMWNLADVAYQSGARIHSVSWGGVCHDQLGNCTPGCTLPYDSLARDADLAMWTYPDLLLVNAVGNAGEFCPPPNSVNTPATAKNTLGVGSLGHGGGAAAPSSFSSRGPVFDGRLKPTVAAQGESVVSAASDANTASNNCATCSLDGSSMSAPTAAGLAALVREYYTAGFYPGGARNPAQGFTPSAALLKATLIDGAAALGAAAPSPDFDAGYGRVLLGSTLAFAGDPFVLRVDDHREGIITGSVVSHAFDVSGTQPFRATLVWTDFPAALNAAVARVNELKLEVIDPSGNVWFQTLDPATDAPVQTMDAGDPHDTVNVEERLVFSSPVAGRWVVRVRGVDVPWWSQPFALVVRGALTDCPAPGAPGQPTLATPADHQVSVSWNAVAGAVSYNVYRSFGDCPGGPWVPVATAVTGTSFTDTGLSGGTRYSYFVTAASDPGGFCESQRSPCASVVPTGDCFLAPQCRGVTGGASAGLAGCAIAVSWDPAAPYCGSDVRYNVYRGTTSGFTPGPTNRIARCVGGTSYSDSTNLSYGTRYHYVVRAEDAATGHDGPCRGGNEDANLAETSAVPEGPLVLGTWSDDAGDTGSARFAMGGTWTNPTSGGHTGPRVYQAASAALLCGDLTSPELTLAGPGFGPQLSFTTVHDLEYDEIGIFGAEGSLGQVEIAVGPNFTNWTRVPLTPGYPALVEFTINECPTTGNPNPTTYFSGIDMVYSTYTASLANWAGGAVKIRFHLSGDFFYPGGNWWIDEVVVTQAMVPGPCSIISAGPPPIPDGASAPGTPLQVGKSGTDLLLTWDAAQCPAAAVNVYRGPIGNFSGFTAGDCGLPATGSATLALPGDVWFLVVATDGGSTDGSWSRDASGDELSYSGASLACPAVTQHVTNNGCP